MVSRTVIVSSIVKSCRRWRFNLLDKNRYTGCVLKLTASAKNL